MNLFPTSLALGLFAAAALAAPALADPTGFGETHWVSRTVHLADVDLQTTDGAKVAAWRIRRAADDLCGGASTLTRQCVRLPRVYAGRHRPRACDAQRTAGVRGPRPFDTDGLGRALSRLHRLPRSRQQGVRLRGGALFVVSATHRSRSDGLSRPPTADREAQHCSEQNADYGASARDLGHSGSGASGSKDAYQQPQTRRPTVSTIGKPVHERRRPLSTIFSIIDRTAMFVAYAVFIAVLPCAAVGFMTHTV